jgi:hypothetical protein
VSGAFAHCEIPCGIYGDHARIESLCEDCTTTDLANVEKLRTLVSDFEAVYFEPKHKQE